MADKKNPASPPSTALVQLKKLLPMTTDELAKLEQAVGLTNEDRRYLRLAGDVLADQAEAVVDCWRGIIGQQPHLDFYSLGLPVSHNF